MLLGLATTIFGGLMGWLVGKRKQNAESSLIEVEAMEAIKEFYKGALNDTNKTLTKANVKLTLMLIDNLPADGVDYVKEQWGREMVVEGCAYYEDNPYTAS